MRQHSSNVLFSSSVLHPQEETKSADPMGLIKNCELDVETSQGVDQRFRSII